MESFCPLFVFKVLLERVVLLREDALLAGVPLSARVQFLDRSPLEVVHAGVAVPQPSAAAKWRSVSFDGFPERHSQPFYSDLATMTRNLQERPLSVTLYQQHPAAPLPVVVGAARVPVSEAFGDLLSRARKCAARHPLSAVVRGKYPVLDADKLDVQVGTVSLSARLVCFDGEALEQIRADKARSAASAAASSVSSSAARRSSGGPCSDDKMVSMATDTCAKCMLPKRPASSSGRHSHHREASQATILEENNNKSVTAAPGGQPVPHPILTSTVSPRETLPTAPPSAQISTARDRLRPQQQPLPYEGLAGGQSALPAAAECGDGDVAEGKVPSPQQSTAPPPPPSTQRPSAAFPACVTVPSATGRPGDSGVHPNRPAFAAQPCITVPSPMSSTTPRVSVTVEAGRADNDRGAGKAAAQRTINAADTRPAKPGGGGAALSLVQKPAASKIAKAAVSEDGEAVASRAAVIADAEQRPSKGHAKQPAAAAASKAAATARASVTEKAVAVAPSDRVALSREAAFGWGGVTHHAGQGQGQHAAERGSPTKQNLRDTTPGHKDSEMDDFRRMREAALRAVDFEINLDVPLPKYGHKSCVVPHTPVPGDQGWLWKTKQATSGYQPRRGWYPGAIPRGLGLHNTRSE